MLEPFDQPLASGFGDSAGFMDRMGSEQNSAFDSFYKFLDNNGRLLTMMRYLQPRELERRGLDKFDPWTGTYGVVNESLEPTPSGGYAVTARFSRFKNLPELKALWQNVADIRVAREVPEIQRARPHMVDEEGQLPDRIYVMAPVHPLDSSRMVIDAPPRRAYEPTLEPWANPTAKASHAAHSTAVTAETSRRLSGLPSTAMPEPQRPNPMHEIQRSRGHQLPLKTDAPFILQATSSPRMTRGTMSTASSIRLCWKVTDTGFHAAEMPTPTPRRIVNEHPNKRTPLAQSCRCRCRSRVATNTTALAMSQAGHRWCQSDRARNTLIRAATARYEITHGEGLN